MNSSGVLPGTFLVIRPDIFFSEMSPQTPLNNPRFLKKFSQEFLPRIVLEMSNLRKLNWEGNSSEISFFFRKSCIDWIRNCFMNFFSNSISEHYWNLSKEFQKISSEDKKYSSIPSEISQAILLEIPPGILSDIHLRIRSLKKLSRVHLKNDSRDPSRTSTRAPSKKISINTFAKYSNVRFRKSSKIPPEFP